MSRVLIVDDEEAVRDLIEEVLRAQTHEVHAAANGRDALQILRAKPFDLAIIDRNMPGMTGIEVVRLIRLNPATKDIKVLMCTASSVTKEIDEAFEAGANGYILKPLNFQALLDKVTKTLASPTK